METCTFEVGLLKKKPCGQPSVTHCLNCEQPLCSKHAVPEVAATGRKTGKFLCKLCAIAQKEHDKIAPPAPVAEKTPAPAPAAAKKPGEPAKEAPKPAAAAAVAKQAPKEAPKEEKKPDDDAPLEFTPTKK